MKCLVNQLGTKCDTECTFVLEADLSVGLCAAHAALLKPGMIRQRPEEKPRFEMLSRADYEAACMELDRRDARVSGEVARGEMDGHVANAWYRQSDREREELKRRLFVTGMILSRRQGHAPKEDTAPVFADVPVDKGRALSDKGIAIVRWNWDKDKGTSTQVRIERSNV